MTRCRSVDVDGTPVLVRGDRELTEADREALRELVAAVEARLTSEPVEVRLARQQRQQEGRERLARLRERLDADPS